MIYEWVRYGDKYYGAVESWLDGDARYFTGCDDGFRETWAYWTGEGGYTNGENAWCMVVLRGGAPTAAILLLRDEDIFTVSELLVAPEYRGMGHGTAILRELLADGEKILGQRVNRAAAVIFPDNPASIKVFGGAGFVHNGTHNDGDVYYFTYNNYITDFSGDLHMDKANISLGIAPIGWTNDDMPDLGGEVTFEQCVSEMALAGFSGCEVGNKYPKDVPTLKKALELRGLRIANAWFSTFLTTKPYEETEAEFVKHIDFLAAMGAKIVGVSEQGHSIQGTSLPVFDAKYVMNDAEWEQLCGGLNRLGKLALTRGISLTFHHHMGTVVQTSAEIDRLMAGTDPALVGLLFDSGHLAYCGEPYLTVLARYVDRVRHVHLKDIRPDVVARVKAEKKSFLEGVRMGAFTVPGDGSVDFAPIFNILDEAGYKGWLLVEAEQDPAVANPLEYAIKARKYIAEKTGL